jgi:hypothetical protein
MSGFYVGYFPKAPRELARFVIRIVAGIFLLAIAICAVLVLAQAPFAAAKFEYGISRAYEGMVYSKPYPMLIAGGSQFLLVAPGKHGFSAPPDGRAKLNATLIERGPDAMLEVSQIERLSSSEEQLNEVSLGSVDIAGEIVDSKCYLGVMNPGATKVHRDCATRCISGGVPPALVARDSMGAVQFILVTGIDVLPYVAESVEVSGTLSRVGSKLILHAKGIKRVNSVIPE